MRYFDFNKEYKKTRVTNLVGVAVVIILVLLFSRCSGDEFFGEPDMSPDETEEMRIADYSPY